MKIIVCTGDSHTWGQGAENAYAVRPNAVAGERRPLPFSIPCYVNVIRREIEQRTDSYHWEAEAPDFAQGRSIDPRRDTVSFSQEDPYTFTAKGELFCFFYYAHTATQGIRILCDGIEAATELPRRFGDDLSYNRLVCHISPVEHTVTVLPTDQTVHLYRIEGYGGTFAVVNSGIGNCPASRYLAQHWAESVEVLRPDYAIVEPHTVNDWLSDATPEEYYETLLCYFKRLKEGGCSPIMLTVAPIFGETALPFSPYPFFFYIVKSREAARAAGIPTADVYQILQDRFAYRSTAGQFMEYANDNWHPNTYGHSVYAEEALRLMEAQGWL